MWVLFGSRFLTSFAIILPSLMHQRCLGEELLVYMSLPFLYRLMLVPSCRVNGGTGVTVIVAPTIGSSVAFFSSPAI